MMRKIVLTAEQAKIVAEGQDSVSVLDADGNYFGTLARKDFLSAEAIAEMKRRLASNGPYYTTVEVLKHLRSLEARAALG